MANEAGRGGLREVSYKATEDLRRKLHNLTFDYMELRHDPSAKAEALEKVEKEMRDLLYEIYRKALDYYYGKTK